MGLKPSPAGGSATWLRKPTFRPPNFHRAGREIVWLQSCGRRAARCYDSIRALLTWELQPWLRAQLLGKHLAVLMRIFNRQRLLVVHQVGLKPSRCHTRCHPPLRRFLCCLKHDKHDKLSIHNVDDGLRGRCGGHFNSSLRGIPAITQGELQPHRPMARLGAVSGHGLPAAPVPAWPPYGSLSQCIAPSGNDAKLQAKPTRNTESSRALSSVVLLCKEAPPGVRVWRPHAGQGPRTPQTLSSGWVQSFRESHPLC